MNVRNFVHKLLCPRKYIGSEEICHTSDTYSKFLIYTNNIMVRLYDNQMVFVQLRGFNQAINFNFNYVNWNKK